MELLFLHPSAIPASTFQDSTLRRSTRTTRAPLRPDMVLLNLISPVSEEERRGGGSQAWGVRARTTGSI